MANRILHNSRKSITPRITWKPVRVPQEFGNVTQSVPRCPRYEAAFYRLYNGRRIKTRQAQALSLLLRLKKNIAVKLFFDLFPIILFFGAFKFGESDPQTAADILTLITGGTGPEHAPVMLATLVAIVSTFVQIAIVFVRGKKPEPMLWISLAVIVVFGSLTIWLQNEMFIKWKPSILYWIFGGILLFAQCTGRNYIRKLLSNAEIKMPDTAWNTLQKAWIAFFATVGVISLVVAYTCATDTWVNFKLFGLMGLTLIFTIGMGFWIAKHVPSMPE